MKGQSKYNEIYVKLARLLSARGLTKKEIARALELPEKTLYRWQDAHPEFKAALEAGIDRVEQVEDTFYQRALGYEIEEKKVIGKEVEGQLKAERVEIIKKQVLPNVEALKYILSHKKPSEWAEKMKIEHTGQLKLLSVKKMREALKKRDEEEENNDPE